VLYSIVRSTCVHAGSLARAHAPRSSCRPTSAVETTRRPATGAKSPIIDDGAWNVIATVEFGVVLTPGAEELARTDTAAHVRRPHVRDPMVWSHGFNARFLNKKRPSLPRITCCLSRGPRESALSRAELGTTPSPGNAHPIPHPHPIADGDGWGWMGDFGPIGFHPTAHPSPSKAHPKRVWMGILGAVTMNRSRNRVDSRLPCASVLAHQQLEGRQEPPLFLFDIRYVVGPRMVRACHVTVGCRSCGQQGTRVAEPT